MSSVPTTSHLTASPTPDPSVHRVHRHRRSAAISGDFDVVGLGLFSPPSSVLRTSRATSASASPLEILQHSAFHQRLFLGTCVSHSHNDDELDKHFRFSNEDDFTNKVQLDVFNFPSRNAVLALLSLPSTPKTIVSPARKFGMTAGDLNSPIRLKTKKSGSSVSCPLTPKLFLTETTTLNDENVPDPVIDLDEIINANMRITESDIDTDQLRYQEAFLASPFAKTGPLTFSSPYTSSSYHKQQIRDVPADAIEEEDDLEDYKLADEDLSDQRVEPTTVSDEKQLNAPDFSVFSNPQESFGGLYLTLSANSSNSSLPSTGGGHRLPFLSMIEKTSSNSSKDSGMSTFLSNGGTPASKRSSAKATRYQTFYDQSYKISSALKYSSSESIHLIPQANDLTVIEPNKDSRETTSRILGHSSSLPSLQSGVKKSASARMDEIRTMRTMKGAKSHVGQQSNTSNLQEVRGKLRSPGIATSHCLSSSQPKRYHYSQTSKVPDHSNLSPDLLPSKSTNSDEPDLLESIDGVASSDPLLKKSSVRATSTSSEWDANDQTKISTPVIVVSADRDPASELNTMISTLSSEATKDIQGASTNIVRQLLTVPAVLSPLSTEETNLAISGKVQAEPKLHSHIRDDVYSILETCLTEDLSSGKKERLNTRRRSDRISSWFRRAK